VGPAIVGIIYATCILISSALVVLLGRAREMHRGLNIPFTRVASASHSPAFLVERLEDNVEAHVRNELALNVVVGDSPDSIPFGVDETWGVESSASTFTGMRVDPSSPCSGACNPADLGEIILVSAASYLSEVVEIAPAPVAVESVEDTGALPVQEVAAVVEIAPAPVAVESVEDTGALPVQEVAAVVEIATDLVAVKSVEDTTALPVQQGTEELPRSFPVVYAKEERRPLSFLTFYGLSEQPFEVTPDPAYLYLSRMHREALTSLSQGIQDLRGFMALIAEPGMGKTTLLNKLMEELRDSARIVFLFQTQCNSHELLRYLLSELGIENVGMDLVAMHQALNEVLFREMLQGRRFVLIVDEAQNLHDSVLETIRLLSDFETTHRKLIQIVLAGQPKLVDTLMQPSLSQLRQRIAILTNLEPLCATETSHYIEHRLRAAGSSDEPLFTREALALIAERSQGTPRSINNLCFNALRLGYVQGTKTIDSKIVQAVVAKLDFEALRCPQQDRTDPQRARRAVPNISEQLASVLLAALAREGQPDLGQFGGTQSKASVTLTGKLTEKLRSRSWGKENEFRIQVSLERHSSSNIPVADRYYCCSFYVGEEQASVLRAGQLITIKIE
jgi:general secretion pathway protein A